MTIQTLPNIAETAQHDARLRLPLDSFLRAFQPVIAAFELPVTRIGASVQMPIADGRLILGPGKGETLLRIEAMDASQLATVRDAVSHIVGDLHLPRPLEWAADRTEARPANLTIARIAANERLSPSFQRIRLAGDLGRFATGGLHFRLNFGPDGAGWPVADATGTAIWPGGIERWHRPVYTVRAIDPGHRWIDVDIFLHDGGRVSDWVARVPPGTEVALTGPSGRPLHAAGWTAYLGDETALPVIARAVQLLPADARGAVRLFTADARDRQPLGAPAGVDVQWLVHGRDGSLLDALKALRAPAGDRFIFLAGERQIAAAAREYLAAAGFQRGEFSAVAYWAEE